jgi:hypothetical protein
MTESAELLVSLSLEDGDQRELDDLTRELGSEIGRINVDSIEDVSLGEAPAGTKAADWAAIGQMTITLAPTVIPILFEVLRSWAERKSSTRIKINIKVGQKNAQIEYNPTKTSAEEIESLIKKLRTSVKK